jgi:hypothetical protein
MGFQGAIVFLAQLLLLVVVLVVVRALSMVELAVRAVVLVQQELG